MKKLLLFVLAFSMVISFALPFSFSAVAEGEDVIEIDTAEELLAIGTDETTLAGNYKLTADIVTTTGIEGDFTGTFDGDGHKISGLTTALFQEITGATVKNVTVSGNVVGSSAAKADRGAIVIEKIDTSATVENVVVEGTLTYDLNTIESYVGALVGECWPGSAGTNPDPEINIIGCTNKARLEITDPHKFSVGGLIGYCGGFGILNVTECVNEGDINVTYTNDATAFEGTISGVIGRGNESKTNNDIVRIYLERCANVGDITINALEGKDIKGSANGVIGQMPAGYLKYCYNAGNIVHNGNGNANGLIGWQHSKAATIKTFSLEYCYNLSETRVDYEFVPAINQVDWSDTALLLQGNHYLTGANSLFGSVAAEHLDNGDPNVECANVEEMFESLAQYGYVRDPNVAYPILPFQLNNLTLEHTDTDGSSFFYQQGTTDTSKFRIIGLIDTDVAKTASKIEVTFTNAEGDTKTFVLGDDEKVYAYSSIDATFNETTVTYVACDGAVILGWVFSGVPAGYVPSAAVIVE